MKNKRMTSTIRAFLLALGIVSATAANSSAQNCVGIGGGNPSVYTQNFDGLGNSPAPQNSDAGNVLNLTAVAPAATARRFFGKFDNAVSDGGGTVNVPGWAVVEEGSSTSAVTGRYYISDGSLANGNTGSFGGSGAADRAFGSLNEDGVIVLAFLGGCFVNAAPVTISSVQINYTGEAWRIGGSAADRLNFQYAVSSVPNDGGNIFAANGGTAARAFTDFDGLDFVAPTTAGTTAGARDGNQAANRTVYAATTVPVTLAPGDRLYVRWADNNLAGVADDALAIDDFTIRFGAPTVAESSIGGRVTKENGAGVAGARITLTDASGGARVVQTNPFGFYRFERVPAGATYVVSARSKRHRFGAPARAVTVNENLDQVNFTALP